MTFLYDQSLSRFDRARADIRALEDRIRTFEQLETDKVLAVR